jgi:hypothetical protein
VKNVIVGKGGLSTRLNPRRWGSQPPFDWMLTLAAIAACNPSTTFWYVSKTDFNSVDRILYNEWFPHRNVRFYEKKISGTNFPEQHTKQFANWLESEGVVPDAGVFDLGIFFSSNFYNYAPKINDPTAFVKPSITAFQSTAPTLWAINWARRVNPNFNWVSLTVDPRGVLKQYELEVEPIVQLSNCVQKYQARRWRGDHWEIIKLQSSYYNLMSSAVVGAEVEDLAVLESEKCVDLGMAINGIRADGYTTNRWPAVKMVVSAFPDAEVYGKWNQELVPEQDWPILECGCFKGVVSKPEVDKISRRWRYTVLSSNGKGHVTPKFYECLMSGVLPLFAPDYDTDRRYNAVPSFLRLSSFDPEELRRTVDKVSEVRFNVLQYLREKYLDQEALDGVRLNRDIMRHLDPSYEGPDECPEIRGFWGRVLKLSETRSTLEELF